MATATWRTDLDEDDRRATVVVEHVRPLAKRAVASISAEARRLLRVTQPEAEHDVRFLHRS